MLIYLLMSSPSLSVPALERAEPTQTCTLPTETPTFEQYFDFVDQNTPCESMVSAFKGPWHGELVRAGTNKGEEGWIRTSKGVSRGEERWVRESEGEQRWARV